MKKYLALFFSFLLTFAATAQPFGPPNINISAYRSVRITTLTDTMVKSGAGVLHTICLNNPAATGTITVYDNTVASGTVLAAITMSASSGNCFTYDLYFNTGLTITTAVAAGDLTVAFY